MTIAYNTEQFINVEFGTSLSGFSDPNSTDFTSISPAANEVGDAAGDTTTNATLTVGDTFDGTISTGTDQDWVEVTLEAGESYVFTVWGTGASGLSDTTLTLYDANGNQIDFNDDIANASGNHFSQIEFTATVSGTYYLAVEGYGGGTGDYRLQATTNVFSVDDVATQLTEVFWGVTVPLHFDVATGGTITVNLTALTPEGQQLARWALEVWSNATGLNFVEVAVNGDIRFDDDQSGAFAGPASYNPTTGVITYSTVNVGTGWLASYGTTLDSYSYLTYIHEIGHALGLGHAGNYDGVATYGDDNHYLNDSYQMTVMSYFSQTENTYINAGYALPVTLMIGDIAATDFLYGESTTSYLGNTVWGANSNVGGILGQLFGYLFDGVTPDPSVYAGGPVTLTIRDSGGIDTLDFSTVAVDQQIDLRAGAVSDINGGTGNLVISLGTVIENLISGDGNDTLSGNDAANDIRGGGGNDTLDGGAGNDTLYGDAGTDAINGGDGADRIYGGVDADVIYGGEGNDVIAGDGGHDTIYGGGGADLVNGGNHSDTVYGGDGNDRVLGEAGFDHLYGDAGDDVLVGGDDNDRLYGGDDNDLLRGGTGEDRLYGDAGDDVLYGDGGFDRLEGGAGNDTLDGGNQADNLFGGIGNDTLIGGQGFDRLFGGAGDDVLDGGTETDGLFGEQGNDILDGGAGNDRVWGGTGNDTLFGGDGDDEVFGGAGFDVINGGAGNDTLAGNFNADTFVFADGFGADVITDFEATNDFERIDLSGVSAVTDYADLTANHMTQVGGDVVIDAGGGNTITLTGVNLADLDANDFVF